MKPHDIPDTDRETLSALFDGALDGDARRFASRRLAHDTAWQEDCGRWQLIGDAMRRQAPIAAPADFAERVRATIAERSPPAATTTATPTSRRPVRLWAGGALAASLALLAVFATRSPAPAPQARPAIASVPVASPQAPGAAANSAAPAVAPAAPVERVAAIEPGPARPQVRAPRRAAGLVRTATREPSSALAASTFTPPDATNPFHVPAADPLATRPWPRAALQADSALTASYGAPAAGRGDAPSFYPFEPRPSADPESRAESR